MDEIAPAFPVFGEVVESHRLAGGAHGTTWLLTRIDGSKVVVKPVDQVPQGAFLAEAEGLAAIAATRYPQTHPRCSTPDPATSCSKHYPHFRSMTHTSGRKLVGQSGP